MLSLSNQTLFTVCFVNLLIVCAIMTIFMHQPSSIKQTNYSIKTINSVEAFPREKIPLEELMRRKSQAWKDYSERRNTIQNYCQAHYARDTQLIRTSSNLPYWLTYIWHSVSYQFSYCALGKVGSSTWRHHLAKLAGKEWGNLHPIGHLMPKVREEFYNFPSNYSLIKATRSEHFTFTFTRHPFSRLLSAYNDKIKDRNGIGCAGIRRAILLKYRGAKNYKNAQKMPTPSEFSRYLVSTAKSKGADKLDPHFKPQSLTCPHCLVDFDVIGRVETMEQDNAYIAKALGIEEILNLGVKFNTAAIQRSSQNFSREQIFFRELKKSTIDALYDLYQTDFDMFGYERRRELFYEVGREQGG